MELGVIVNECQVLTLRFGVVGFHAGIVDPDRLLVNGTIWVICWFVVCHELAPWPTVRLDPHMATLMRQLTGDEKAK